VKSDDDGDDEHSLLGTFAPVELSFLGSERSKNFSFLELSFLWNFRSFRANRLFQEGFSLLWNFRFSGMNVPRTFVPVELSFLQNE